MVPVAFPPGFCFCFFTLGSSLPTGCTKIIRTKEGQWRRVWGQNSPWSDCDRGGGGAPPRRLPGAWGQVPPAVTQVFCFCSRIRLAWSTMSNVTSNFSNSATRTISRSHKTIQGEKGSGCEAPLPKLPLECMIKGRLVVTNWMNH